MHTDKLVRSHVCASTIYITTLRPKTKMREYQTCVRGEGEDRAPMHITVIKMLICVHNFLFNFFLPKSPMLDKVEKELRKEYLQEVS
jgi:hypothetical protein